MQLTPSINAEQTSLLTSKTSTSGWRGISKLVYLLLVLAVCSGITFGYQALEPVLIGGDVFGEYCQLNESHPCAKQLLQLNLLSQLASSMNNVFMLPIGYCIDRFGARKVTLGSSIAFICALLMFGLASLGASWMLYIAFSVLAICGTATSVACISVAGDFGPPSGAVIR